MIEEELTELVAALRSFGTDVANVEAKRARDGLPKTVRDTLSAFSNTAGGIILLGLDESGGFRTTGVAEPKRMADAVASMAANEMEPPLRPLIMPHRFEGQVLLVVEVAELDPALKPCFYRGEGMTRGSFVRVGDSDRRLSSYEVQLMLASRGQPRHDEEAVPEATPEALDRDLVRPYCDRLRATRPSCKALGNDAILQRSRVLVRDSSGGWCASLAGLLALGAFPQQFFPQLNLTFVHYPTVQGGALDGDRFIDNASLDGPIPVIVRDALMVLRKNMTRRAVIAGAGRTDVWEYPEATLREAVVNALVHRDLSGQARGTHVQIEMYPDRLSIWNAGGLFGPVTLERLGEDGVSAPRNATLMRILEDVGEPDGSAMVCESRGSGIQMMIRELRRAGMTPPRFDDRVATFRVTFPNHSLMSEETVAWISSLREKTLTDSQILALALLHDGEVLDNAQYRAATGVDSRVATAELQDLVARELVAQAGQRRWARYILTERASRGDPATQRREPADRRDEILAALGADPQSRAELTERLGLGDQTVRRWLGILRREGRIELTTGSPQSRHARYRRLPEPKQETLF